MTCIYLVCVCVTALGGSDLKTLYVTSASIDCPESEKGAGGLWAIRVDTPGIPEPRYQG